MFIYQEERVAIHRFSLRSPRKAFTKRSSVMESFLLLRASWDTTWKTSMAFPGKKWPCPNSSLLELGTPWFFGWGILLVTSADDMLIQTSLSRFKQYGGTRIDAYNQHTVWTNSNYLQPILTWFDYQWNRLRQLAASRATTQVGNAKHGWLVAEEIAGLLIVTWHLQKLIGFFNPSRCWATNFHPSYWVCRPFSRESFNTPIRLCM